MSTQMLTYLAIGVIAVIVLKRLLGGGKVASSIVKQKLESGAIIIDVRTPDEFRDGAYPGAKNIPLSDLGRRLGEIPKDRPVVLYCASGARSSSAARAMRQAGYADVINAGGLADMPS
ncbi:MAG: rhodanese-like domain-containing protein [Polyangia bacterium]